jgi:hypothetical protein
LYTATLPEAIFPQEVPAPNQRIPKNIQQALSPKYVDEWCPAIDKENKGFHSSFSFLCASSSWVVGFQRKRDGTPKARFCVGGHRQIMGRDYKNYCAQVVTIASCWLW